MDTVITRSFLLEKIEEYRRFLDVDPASLVFVPLSEAYRKLNRLEDARTTLETGLMHHPDASAAHVVLGRVLCQLSEYQASEAAFERVLGLDENSLAGLVGYARLCLFTDRTRQAEVLLNKAQARLPADPIIGQLLSSLEEPVAPQPGTAADESEELVSETLADIYFQQGFPDKALAIWHELLKTDPDNLELRRKIRDVEGTALGGGTPSAPETVVEDEVPVTLPTDLDKDVLEDVFGGNTSTAAGAERSTTVVEAPVGQEAPQAAHDAYRIETLTRWLENIEQRRKNV